MNSLTLISINIINKENVIINKKGVPIIMYTEEPEKTISELKDINTNIGSLLFDFFINNICNVVINDGIDNYVGSKLIYIYYNPETNNQAQNELLIEDIYKLSLNDKTKQLYLYYIKHAIKNVCRKYKYMLNKNLTEKINNIQDNETVKELYEYLASRNGDKYSTPYFVKAIQNELEQTYQLSKSNVINLMDILI